jgi:hypothetical protein
VFTFYISLQLAFFISWKSLKVLTSSSYACITAAENILWHNSCLELLAVSLWIMYSVLAIHVDYSRKLNLSLSPTNELKSGNLWGNNFSKNHRISRTQEWEWGSIKTTWAVWLCVHPFDMDCDFKVMPMKIINCMGITCISIVAVHIPVYFSHALSENNMSFASQSRGKCLTFSPLRIFSNSIATRQTV